MVEQVTGGKALPAEVVQQIVAKTDGVPLFVEELTKMVVESGYYEKRMIAMSSARRCAYPAVGDSFHVTGLADGAAGSAWHRSKRLPSWVRPWAGVSYELLHAVSPLDEGPYSRGCGS